MATTPSRRAPAAVDARRARPAGAGPAPVRALRQLLAAGLLAALAGCGGAEAPAEVARPVLVVQVAADAAGTPSAYPGEVRARHEPALAFRIPGKLAAREVDVGDRVEAGQVLARLDPADTRLQRDAAAAELTAAEADLARARADFERFRDLVERQVVSRSQFEAQQAGFRAAEARVQQARAQAEVAANQAAYAELRAPAAGVIAQRLVETGQVVAAGQAAFVLAEDGEREVAIALPEHQARAFAPGREVAVELWAAPGRLLRGVVREVAPAADAASRTFAARVTLLDADAAVDVGQSARVLVAASGEDAGALALPLGALQGEDGAATVWVVEAGADGVARVARRGVRTGPYGQAQVPVLEGLAAGEWVVAAGGHLLREGQAVRPVDRDDRPVPVPAAAPAPATSP